MKKTFTLFLLTQFFFAFGTFAQDFLITPPVLTFDGKVLNISYDIISKNKSDQFYIWINIQKKNGEPVAARSFSGDVGEKVNAGTGKKVIWIPERDSVFLDEEINVEINAEKYSRSFNKGSAVLLSAALPGLGQTKIGNGKPYWLTGVAAYSIIAGGLIAYSSSIKTYDRYKTQENPAEREDLYNKAQNQMTASRVLIISGAVVWAANIIWVALIPQKYKPLKNVNFSLEKSASPTGRAMLLTLSLNF